MYRNLVVYKKKVRFQKFRPWEQIQNLNCYKIHTIVLNKNIHCVENWVPTFKDNLEKKLETFLSLAKT